MFIIKTQTKITIALAGLIALLALVCIFLFGMWKTERANAKRMLENVIAIEQSIRYNADSTQAQVKAIRMELSEVKKAFPDLKQELKAHGIKLRNVEQYQHSLLGIKADFKAKIEQRDSTTISAYADKWLTYIATIKPTDTTQHVTLSMDVDLKQVVHRQRPPGFWGFLKKRQLVQDIWTENPYAKLKFNRIIQIK